MSLILKSFISLFLYSFFFFLCYFNTHILNKFHDISSEMNRLKSRVNEFFLFFFFDIVRNYETPLMSGKKSVSYPRDLRDSRDERGVLVRKG